MLSGPNNDFCNNKIMIIKMVNELGRRMTSSMNLGVNHSEKFNKELENIVKNQTELILL